MKTSHAAALAAAAVLVTVAIEEARIATLRAALKSGEKSSSAAAPKSQAIASKAGDAPGTAPVRTKNRAEAKPPAATEPAEPAESAEESLAKTARKMWDNPAGKSMMNQGVKMAVAMMYQDFIEGLDLTKEESDYFRILLGKEMADQQELGMKMLGASEEERKTLAAELTQRSADAEAEIRKFLNSEEDFKAYKDYKNRLPERQQLDGIRATLSAKGLALDADTETQLVDAMYRARTESKAPDLSGPAGLNELASGNIVETFEKSWASQQEALRSEVGKILSEPQMAAFQEYQQQAKEMQLMGLKMAEQMMPGKKDKAESSK
jgi:hypothetical protein